MPYNLTQKIISSHLAQPSDMTPGQEIFLAIDQTLTHDITAVMGYLAFEQIGLPRVRTEVRLRDNLFEDHTVSETKVIASLVIMLCVSGGVLLDFLFPVHCISGVTPFLSVLALAVCVAGYYAFQLCAYSVVGYVFTTRVSARIWLRGFNASQVLLSLCVWVPALIVLFNPALGSSMLIVGGVLYILARIIFISKGFRIFYNNIPSLIYFILYLCALEIIPLVIAAHVAHFLTQT